MTCRLLPASKEHISSLPAASSYPQRVFKTAPPWRSHAVEPFLYEGHTRGSKGNTWVMRTIGASNKLQEGRLVMWRWILQQLRHTSCEPVRGSEAVTAHCCHSFSYCIGWEHSRGQKRIVSMEIYTLCTCCQDPSPPQKNRSPLKSPGLDGS